MYLRIWTFGKKPEKKPDPRPRETLATQVQKSHYKVQTSGKNNPKKTAQH